MSASQRRKPYSRKASRKWCPDSSTNEGALGAFFRLWLGLQLVDVATVTAGALPERSQRDALSHELVVAMLCVECLVLVDVCLAESFQLAGSEPG